MVEAYLGDLTIKLIGEDRMQILNKAKACIVFLTILRNSINLSRRNNILS